MKTAEGKTTYHRNFSERIAVLLRRAFRGASRGAGYVEYLLIGSLCGLALILTFQRFRAKENVLVRNQSKTVVALDTPNPQDVIAALGGYEDYTERLTCTGDICMIPGQCFAAGTLVATESGDRPIESIRAGDRVWSWNETTRVVALHAVIRLFVTHDRYVVDLKLSHGALDAETVTVTPNHPFWVEGQGWTPAESLATDAAWSPDGPVSAATTYARTETTTVYNFEVEGDHTYFVGRSHALVHNAGGVGGGPGVCPGPGGGGAGGSQPAPKWTPPDRADQLWAKGKLKTHFEEHGAEVGAKTKEEYTQMAVDFATAPNTDGRFIDMQNGPFFYRYEPATGKIFVGTIAGQKIKTFYKWDGRPDDEVINSMKAAGLIP